MNHEEATRAIQQLQKCCDSIFEVAETALKNKQSLTGKNFYGNKFNVVLIELSTSERWFSMIVSLWKIPDDTSAEIRQAIAVLKSVNNTVVQRREAVRNIRLLCQSVIIPHLNSMTSDPRPQTEQVLPAAVVHGTRGYIVHMIVQANGCYERQWFDACSVMLRRFVETLIIQVYEAHGKADTLKHNGEYRTLKDLINIALSDAEFNLSRDTKHTLPLIKEMGDRSAHNRYYLATKADVDKVIPGLRVVADELLHLAKLK